MARPEIRGIVLEPDIDAPMAGAEVTVDYHGPARPRLMPSPPNTTVAVKTGEDGRFTVHPETFGFFNVRVRKEGYTAAGPTDALPIPNRAFTLTPGDPLRELQFLLARPAIITGRVVDAATHQPIANLRLRASRAAHVHGHRAFFGVTGVTNAEGRFFISCTAGNCVVEIGPQIAGRDRVHTTFSSASLDTVDYDYEHTFWPGGGDRPAALPVAAPAGQTLDIGLVPVRKVPYYRLLVQVPSAGCDPGDTLTLHEYWIGPEGHRNTTHLASQIPCGTDLLVTGFAPGAYRLIVHNHQRPASRRTASVPFVIAGQNVEITAALQPAITLEGQFVLDHGAPAHPDFPTFPVPGLHPIGGIPFADVAMSGQVDADGRFRIVGLPALDHHVDPSLPDDRFYIKEIRCNGALVRDAILPMEQPSPSHSLTLLLGGHPATVTGTVTDGGQPAAAAYVVAAPWPLPTNRFFQPAVRSSTADARGRFRINLRASSNRP